MKLRIQLYSFSHLRFLYLLHTVLCHEPQTSLILIVDDTIAMRQTIRALLQEVESEFCECDDGSKALALYRTHHPEWVLMDVRMPTVDGIAATRQIIATFPDARIIMISHYSDPLLVQQALAAGALAYVLKDDLSQLPSVMHRLDGSTSAT